MIKIPFGYVLVKEEAFTRRDQNVKLRKVDGYLDGKSIGNVEVELEIKPVNEHLEVKDITGKLHTIDAVVALDQTVKITRKPLKKAGKTKVKK